MKKIKVFDIIDFLNSIKIRYKYDGNLDQDIVGFSIPPNYKVDTVTWAKTQEVAAELNDIGAALVFAQTDLTLNSPNVIYAEQSKFAFFTVLKHFWGDSPKKPVIGQGTYLSPNVVLGQNVSIGHNCTIDGSVSVGDNTVIGNNVVIVNRVEIGRKCTIHSGTVIGHDGYEYADGADGPKVMIEHLGGVFIGDDVFIGANIIIDRGVIEDTIIKQGARICAMCHIAHSCVIDENVSLVAGTILYGHVRIEKNSYIAGGMIKNRCTIGADSFVTMGSVIVKDIPPHSIAVGTPHTKLWRSDTGK